MKRLTWKSLLGHDPEGGDRYCCPFPPCDEKPVNADHRSLAIDAESGAYLCHRCGRTGKLNIQSPGSPLVKKKEKTSDWKEIWDAGISVCGDPYLYERGIDRVTNDIRFHPSFYYEPSILFGIRNWTGELIGCQGRRINPKEGHSKVCTAAGSQQGIFLSSKQAVLCDPLIICEAPIDALSLETLGYPAISVQGTGLPEWINYLTYFRRVMIAPDNDVQGKQAAENWRNNIVSMVSDILTPPFGKDWNACIQQDRFGTDEYLRDHLEYKPRGYHPMLEALQSWFSRGGV